MGVDPELYAAFFHCPDHFSNWMVSPKLPAGLQGIVIVDVHFRIGV